MKLRLLTLLAAAALAATPAAAQTIKSLGFNTTNGNVVYSGTNPLTFTNALQFATNANVAGVLTVGALDKIYITGNGIWNEAGEDNGIYLDDRELRAGGGSIVSWSTNGLLLEGGPLRFLPGSSYPATTRTNLGATTVGDAVFTATNAAAGATALGLGTTNDVTFSNITATGTLTATGNVTLSGVANTAPSQTADSGASLMTRDLVGQELANPRNRMQTTYWFGLEGQGGWQVVNSPVIVVINRSPRWGTSLGMYAGSTNNRSSVSAAGMGFRLGSTAITGGSAWRPFDGGAFVLRTHVVNYNGLPSGNTAFGFYMGQGNNTNFWGDVHAVGLWYVAQPTNTWSATNAFEQHTRIAVSNVVFTVSTAGTTATNEPVWPDLINSTVTNGTAVFRNLGPHTSNNWVLARGATNASEVIMTNTGKSNWVRPSGSGHEAVLTLRYGTNTAAPFTYFATVTDGAGQSAEVSIDGFTNNIQTQPQYWSRWDSTNAAVASDVVGFRYFSIEADLPPLTTP